MPVRVLINVQLVTPGLDRAEQTFAESLNTALDNLGRHLQRSLRGRVRRAKGSEQANIKYEVRGQNFNKALIVFGDLIQLWIDEYGLRPGVFPPWQIGSRLYKYVVRLGLAKRPLPEGAAGRRLASHVSTRRPGPRRAAGIINGPPVGGVATPQPRRRVGRARRRAAPQPKRSPAAERRARATRRIAFLVARAIYERGIKARSPIARTFEANRAKIVRDVANAFRWAVNRINRGR